MDYIINHIDREKSSFIHKDLGYKVYKRPMTNLRLKSITIHSTANENSNAVDERRWLENPLNKRWASYHLVVDDKRCIEVIPLTEKALHCGNREGNSTSIGIELCESGNRTQVIENLKEVVMDILYTYKLNPEELYMHRDWDKNQSCPRILSDFLFKKIRKDIIEKYNNTPSFWAKDAWEWGIENKITDGYNPKKNCTREEVIVMLSRL